MKKTIKVKERLERYISQQNGAIEEKKKFIIDTIEEAMQQDVAIQYIFDDHDDYIKLKYYLKAQIFNKWRSDLNDNLIVKVIIHFDNNLYLEIRLKNNFANEIRVKQETIQPAITTNLQQIITPTIVNNPPNIFTSQISRPIQNIRAPIEPAKTVLARFEAAQKAANEAASKLINSKK